MKLSNAMGDALLRLRTGPKNGWALGWGTVGALRRRGMVTLSKQPDHVKLTRMGRRTARIVGEHG